MKKAKLLLVNFILLLLAACSITPVVMEDYFQPPQGMPANGLSSIYIYSIDSHDNHQNIFYIDNKKVAILLKNTYTSLLVSPGIHTISVQNESTSGKGNIRIIGKVNVVKNKIYYIEYTEANEISNLTLMAVKYYKNNQNAFSERMIIHNSYNEASNIAMCRFVKPL